MIHTATHVRNVLVLRLASQSFDAQVLYMEAIIKTASKILARRGNDDASTRARAFLSSLNSEV
eukprot:922700-Amphidinium_carterae.1